MKFHDDPITINNFEWHLKVWIFFCLRPCSPCDVTLCYDHIVSFVNDNRNKIFAFKDIINKFFFNYLRKHKKTFDTYFNIIRSHCKCNCHENY